MTADEPLYEDGPTPGELKAVRAMRKRPRVLYHATTPKKAQRYQESGRIIAPVRGFTTLLAALAWACKTGHTVVLEVQGTNAHKLPDHHNDFGEAWWLDEDVLTWDCVFSPKDA